MKKNILYIVLFAVFFSACDYLDYDEGNYLQKEDVYTVLSRVKSSVTNIYSYLPSGFTQVGNAMLASACDEAVFADDVDQVHQYFNGAWSSSHTLDSRWNYFDAIRAANQFLIEVEKQDYEDYLYDKDPTYDVLMQNVEWYKAEVRALRAFYYFELAKRYGDVPLTLEILTEQQANSITRASFKDVIDFVVSECDTVAEVLLESYSASVDKETGRITKGAALALKARALLYAASPLHNTNNDVEEWKAAAKAAADVIDLKTYILNLRYSDNFNNFKTANTELILERREGNSNSFEKINYPIGYVGGKSGNCPTQNLVDCYEMKATGLAVSNSASGYDSSLPYDGRDPRLALTILYNGAFWKGEMVEVFEGGSNGAPIRYATPTGYYLKKYVIENIKLEPPVTKAEHTWVLFRYAEVLLNYAEAMNEAYGPDDAATFDMTARDAVNQVRSRFDVRMPDFPLGMTPNDFRSKLQNERMVELAFEGHRFWDLRRWKIAEQSKTIKGVEVKPIEGGFEYTPIIVEQRNFQDKMYLYPIPYFENAINSNLGQNTGW